MHDYLEAEATAGASGIDTGAGNATGQSVRTLVSVRDLKKSFGATRVLKGTDFSVRSGEIHALLGGNGGGKSTLIRIPTNDIQKDEAGVAYQSVATDEAVISVVQQDRRATAMAIRSMVDGIGRRL